MILKTLGSVNNLQVQRLDELEKIYLSSSTSVTKDFSLADILTSGNSDNQNIEESKQDAVSAENAVINSETPFVTPTSDTNTQKFDNQSLNSPIPSQEETHALPQVSNESLSSQVELQIFNRLLLDPFNLDLITKEIKEINELYKPKKGNRKAARKLNDQALEALHNDNIEQAIIFLNQAIQSDGSDSEIINNLASAYGRQYN
jgi:tetratricopeptide (TPR) repeat protein